MSRLTEHSVTVRNVFARGCACQRLINVHFVSYRHHRAPQNRPRHNYYHAHSTLCNMREQTLQAADVDSTVVYVEA